MMTFIEETPIDTTSVLVVEENPYVQMIIKRLRSQKKRLARVTQYEEEFSSGLRELNVDQLKAVERKGEIEAVVRELEDTLKAMVIREAEDARAAKKSKKQAYAAEKRAIASALSEAQAKYDSQNQELLRLFYAMNTISQNSENVSHLTEQEREEVESLYSIMTGRVMPMSRSTEAIEPLYQHVRSYMNKSDTLLNTMSYAALQEVVQRILEKHDSTFVDAAGDYVDTPTEHVNPVSTFGIAAEEEGQGEEYPNVQITPEVNLQGFKPFELNELVQKMQLAEDSAPLANSASWGDAMADTPVELQQQQQQQQTQRSEHFTQPKSGFRHRGRGRGAGYNNGGFRGRGSFRGAKDRVPRVRGNSAQTSQL